METQSGKQSLIGTNNTKLNAKVTDRKVYTAPQLSKFGTIDELTEGLKGSAAKPYLNSGKHNIGVSL